MGTALRMGDAMIGLAAVESTRPAWAGTAAATLLNMMIADVCGGIGRFSVLVEEYRRLWKVVKLV